MREENATSAEVSGLSAVTSPNLNVTRAKEYLVGQAIGTTVAMGSVWSGLRLAPKQMESSARLLERFIKKRSEGADPEFVMQEARRWRNYGLMYAGGLCSTISTQLALSRQRHRENDVNEDISLGRDFARLMTGWTVGMVGATGAVAIADRYLRAGSRHSISYFLNDAERFLDKNLLHGAEFAPDNKLSEGLVSNLVMIMGGAPMGVLGQRLYDQLSPHPAITNER